MQAQNNGYRLPEAADLFGALPGRHLLLLPDLPDFTIAAVSGGFLELPGADAALLTGKSVFEVLFGSGEQSGAFPALQRSLETVLQERKEQEGVIVGMRLAPEQHWRVRSRPVVGAGGAITGIISSLDEHSHVVESAEMLEAKKYLQAVIDQSGEPLQVLMPVFKEGEIIDFRFRLTNRAYATYAATTPEALQGRKVSELFPGYFETSSFHNAVQTFRTGETLTFEIHYDKDGLDLYNRMTTSKLGDEVFVYFTDFTEFRKLQIRLERSIKELQRSNSYLEEFAYAASHDLKEPVRKIQAFSSRLAHSLEQRLTDTERDMLRRLQLSADRMGILIDDLLSYSTASVQPLALQPVDLNAVAGQVLEDLDLEIERTDARIEMGPLCTIQGNPHQWKQVFQNLIGNGLKYARPGVKPVISVACEQVPADAVAARLSAGDCAAAFYRISIQDNGIGFEQQYAERIFQVFARLHGRAAYSGSGVGLAIVRKVVESHQGYVWAEGVPGQGATFVVLLPV